MTRTKLFSLSLAAVAALIVGSCVSAAEPNEDFFGATLLVPGVTTVSDDVFGSPTPAPDTTLGAFDESGGLIEVDDDSSSFGNGLGSALFGIPVNADGSIELAVSGYSDFDFDGIDDDEGFDHGQEGAYDLFVDVFDASGELLDFFDEFGELFTGSVESFSFGDPTWAGGTFDVEIDNFVDFEPGDVDFYRFTGLEPGLPFVAEITDGDFDTVLGLFDDLTGDLLDEDDDAGDGLLSLIEGVVPASGEVVLAVTGYADFGFFGQHTEFGDYTLTVTTIPEPGAAAMASIAILLATSAARYRARTTTRQSLAP